MTTSTEIANVLGGKQTLRTEPRTPGVIALAKSLGKELAGSGVLANCVTPGAVRTAIFDQMSETHVAFMLSRIPLGRFGRVDEIAALVAWLCTEECSFSTGAAFDVSGGRATY